MIFKKIKRKLWKIINQFGNKHQCYYCKRTFFKFDPIHQKYLTEISKIFNTIGSTEKTFQCPYCFSADRDRHILMYFDKINFWDKINNSRILHMAPEEIIYNEIKRRNPTEYILGDISNYFLPGMSKIDLLQIKYTENYFDIIICNHVLEHIDDDLRATKEMYRVLKKGGSAILQTPFSPDINKTFTDININTEEKRRRFYGHPDHRRIYGKNIFYLFQEAGFQLRIIENNQFFDEHISEFYGVNHKEPLFLMCK